MTVCSCHVTYVFQIQSTLYSCLNVKEVLAWSRHEIWSLSEYNWTRTQNHLVCKQTLNHLAKLTKWLSCVLSTYLYGAFDCMFLSCHVRVSEWTHTLQLPECQGTPCSKQVRNPKFKWLQQDSKNMWHVYDMTRTYSQMHRTDKYSKQLNHLASLAKWLSACLQTKWFWVRVQLQSIKLQNQLNFPNSFPNCITNVSF